MSEPTDAYSSFGMIPASPIRYGHNDFMSSDELPLPHAQEYDPTESTDQSTHGQDTSTYANINFLQQCPDISNVSPEVFNLHQSMVIINYPLALIRHFSISQGILRTCPPRLLFKPSIATARQPQARQSQARQSQARQTQAKQPQVLRFKQIINKRTLITRLL